MSGNALTLSARGVSVRVNRRTVVRDVDLDAGDGEVVGVVGPNGSGKSTFLRALAGLSEPASGVVLLGGENLHAMPARRRARSIAFVAQEEDMPADLLVHEYVELGRAPHSTPWSIGSARDRHLVDTALADVGMLTHRTSSVDALSGGERRRVVLARGLAQDSAVLVLDEPTNHLDIRHQLDLLDLVRTLGRTVVMALHDLDLAAAVCDRVLVLDNGRPRAFGPPADVLGTATVAAVFGVQAYQLHNPATGRSHLVFEPSTVPTTSPVSESAP